MSILNWTKVGDMPASSILIKLLLYGDSGAGKTWCASTAPKPCFLLTEPNGLPTIRASNPDAVVVQADEANGGMTTVRNFLRAAISGELAEQAGCQSIVIDSLNELQRMLRDEIMAGKRGTPQAGTFTLQDWGTLTDKMRGLVRAFRDLPFHVVGITHASAATDEASGIRYVQPMFQGKSLPNEIAGYFSAVGFMYREHAALEGTDELQVQHRVLLEGPASVLSKVLPGLDAVEVPDIGSWLERMAAHEPGVKPTPRKAAADPTAPPKKKSRRAAANS